MGYPRVIGEVAGGTATVVWPPEGTLSSLTADHTAEAYRYLLTTTPGRMDPTILQALAGANYADLRLLAAVSSRAPQSTVSDQPSVVDRLPHLRLAARDEGHLARHLSLLGRRAKGVAEGREPCPDEEYLLCPLDEFSANFSSAGEGAPSSAVLDSLTGLLTVADHRDRIALTSLLIDAGEFGLLQWTRAVAADPAIDPGLSYLRTSTVALHAVSPRALLLAGRALFRGTGTGKDPSAPRLFDEFGRICVELSDRSDDPWSAAIALPNSHGLDRDARLSRLVAAVPEIGLARVALWFWVFRGPLHGTAFSATADGVLAALAEAAVDESPAVHGSSRVALLFEGLRLTPHCSIDAQREFYDRVDELLGGVDHGLVHEVDVRRRALLARHAGSRLLAPVSNAQRPVLVCEVSGQLRGFASVAPTWARLTDAFDLRFVVHTWEDQGRKEPVALTGNRGYPGDFWQQWTALSTEVTWGQLRGRYPKLTGSRLEGVDEATIASMLPEAVVVITPEDLVPAWWGNQHRMLWKVWSAHDVARTTFPDADFYLRMRPDRPVVHVGAQADVRSVLRAVGTRRVAVPAPSLQNPAEQAPIPLIDDQVALADRAGMDAYAGTWTTYEEDALAFCRVEGMPEVDLLQRESGHRNLGLAIWMRGFGRVDLAPALQFGAMADSQVTPQQVRSMLLSDAYGRMDPWDVRLLASVEP